MIGIRGGVEVLCMAVEAGRSNALELVSRMAGDAFHPGMGSGESKASEPGVIKLGFVPGVHGMAGFASDGQVGGTVVERPGLYVIRPVAGDAFGAQSAKNAGGGATVAGFAGGHCVSAEKRKAVLVGADLLGGDFPSGNGVAVLAGGAELPAVDIGVAIRALLSNVGEDRLRVAQAAGHAFVHAAQRIAGLNSVVELRYGPDGSPTGGGVAIAARNLESRSMRTAAVLTEWRLLILGGAKRCPQQKRPGNSYRPVRNKFLRFPQTRLLPQ